MDFKEISDNEIASMKLLHYFIVEKNYEPIILHGVKNEIWLENLKEEYKIVRIVSNYIHNDEQYEFDKFKSKRISKQIGNKIFSYNLNILSIYLDIGSNVHLVDDKKFKSIFIEKEEDLYNDELLKNTYPDFKEKVNFKEAGFDLFVKISEDINKKNSIDNINAESVFKRKKPTITYILIALNIFIYFICNMLFNYDDILDKYCLYQPLIKMFHEYYRIITSGFFHVDIIHLLVNMYSLYIIGSQIENYFEKIKYIIIYIFSMIGGNLLSMALSNNPSVGASGAIFGLMGSMLYFGYHYRVYLGSVLKSQIIPLIIMNLVIGFLSSGIDNFAHIGGLISGFLITMAVGVKYKSSKTEIINGIILTAIFTLFLIYMSLIIQR